MPRSMTWCCGCASGPAWISIRTGAGTFSFATRSLRDGVPVEVVSRLLGHSSITTTVSVYGHLTAEDARNALEAAGWFTGTGVTL